MHSLEPVVEDDVAMPPSVEPAAVVPGTTSQTAAGAEAPAAMAASATATATPAVVTGKVGGTRKLLKTGAMDIREPSWFVDCSASAQTLMEFAIPQAPDPDANPYQVAAEVTDAKTWTLPQGWEPPSVLEQPVIHDLPGMLAWPNHNIGALQRSVPLPSSVLGFLRHALATREYRTMFSGVDAPGIAAHCIAAELASLLNVDKVQAPIHKSAVEYNPACQAELLQQQTCKPSCLFGDCQSFWIPRVRDTLEKLKKENAPLNRVTMMPLVKSGKACTRRAWCEVHKKHCDIQPARDLWAGFPCVSWSPQGQRERDNGQDFLSFCAFAALTLELEDGAVVGVVTRGGEVGEDDTAVVECSSMYDCSILQECWKEKYHCWFVVMDAVNFGCCVRRQRMWGFAAHRRKAMEYFAPPPLHNIIPLFYRPMSSEFSFRSFLVATDEELDAELLWASSRPKSLALGKTLPTIKALRDPFWECLTLFLSSKGSGSSAVGVATVL
ncbi:unnamed protein product [Symbiodinium microadriaticum]|nr:unnamed protein product [Symbiodinium microadriaticum]CAE7944734.1 unnamed protein product [Symbiodinium sp. KB8]